MWFRHESCNMLQPDQERLLIYATNKKTTRSRRSAQTSTPSNGIVCGWRYHQYRPADSVCFRAIRPRRRALLGEPKRPYRVHFSRSRICRLSGGWETLRRRRLRDVQLLGNGNEVTKMAPFRLDSCQHGGKFFWPVDADVPPRSDAFMHNSASVRRSRGKYPRQRAKENNVQSVAR